MSKITYGLIAVLILLAAYLYFVELRGAKEASSEATRIFSFSEQEITQLTVTGEQGRFVIRVNHAETPFRIMEPVNTLADRGAVSMLARQIADLKPVKTIVDDTAGADLAPFGLSQPAYSVDILATGSTTPLLLGGDNISGQVYAHVGNKIYLIESTIKASLHRGLNDWRKQEVFDFSISDVASLALDGKQGKIMLAKEGNDWMITTDGEKKKAEGGKISELLRHLSFLRGEAFVDNNKEAILALFGSPLLHLKLSLAAKELEGTFFNAEESGFFYVQTTSDAPLYKISQDRFNEINRPISDFQPSPQKEADAHNTKDSR